MIANALRADIVRPLNATLARLDSEAVRANVGYLFLGMRAQLLQATDRARATGEERLADYLEQRLALGVHCWSYDATELPSDVQIVPASRQLDASLPLLIEEDPSLYLAHLLFLDHLASLLEASDVDGNRENIERTFERIDDLVVDPRKLRPLRRVLHQSILGFEQVCAEIAAVEHDAWLSGHDPAHVSAA